MIARVDLGTLSNLVFLSFLTVRQETVIPITLGSQSYLEVQPIYLKVSM